MDLDRFSSQIIKAAISVHKELGPGLLESVYQNCMIMELERLGVQVRSEVPVEIFFRGKKVHEEGFRIDLLVEDHIIVELKSVEEVRDVHKKQLLTYLRLMNCRLGLLMNFGEELIKDGISRVVNRLPDPPTFAS